MLEDCELNELQVYGAKYTWSKGQGSNMIKERLSRAIAIYLAIENWTMEHVFFNCILSNVVWRNGFSGMQVQRDNNRDNMKFWEDVLEDTTRWTDD